MTSIIIEVGPQEVSIHLRAILSRLNQRVAALIDRDHQIGHSYFMGARDISHLRFAWYSRVIPLLQEYFYGDGERLRAVVGKKFVPEVKHDSNLFPFGWDDFEPDKSGIEVQHFNGRDTEFIEALEELAR